MNNQRDEIIDSIINKIKQSQDILVLTHSLPDGDAIGSLLAMGLLLDKMGKKPYLSWSGKIIVPDSYSFLPGQEYIIESNKFPLRFDLAISLDCANKERLEVFQDEWLNSTEVINIDHHVDNPKYGQINWIEPNTASTSIMIYKLMKELHIDIDKQIATCLYVGIITDTGSFQYANTNPDAMVVASELIGQGLSVPDINTVVFENFSFSYLSLISKVLAKSVFDKKNGLIYSVLSIKDLKETGAKLAETENLINFLRAVKGVRIAALLKEIEQGKKYKVSLRSKDEVDSSKIAGKYGGGGHKKAAGFTVAKDIDEIISDLESEIE